MHIEDLLLAPLPLGSLGAPTDKDALSGELLDPLVNPVALEELLLVGISYDPAGRVAALLVEKPAGGISGGWNTGLVVFRGVRSFEHGGDVEDLVDPARHAYFETGEVPIIPTADGYLARLYDFPGSNGFARIEFASAEFYGGVVAWVGQRIEDSGRVIEIFAPWKVNLHSDIELSVMSVLNPNTWSDNKKGSLDLVGNDSYTPGRQTTQNDGKAWYLVPGSVDTCGPWSWRVLAVESDRVLLIAEQIVALRGFDSSSNDWGKSELRGWMHQELLEKLGTEMRASLVPTTNSETNTQDLVFLLSAEEATRYFSNDSSRQATYRGRPFWWWLRAPGRIGLATGSPYCPFVDHGGWVNEFGNIVDRDYIGVRPALWLDICYWSDASTRIR